MLLVEAGIDLPVIGGDESAERFGILGGDDDGQLIQLLAGAGPEGQFLFHFIEGADADEGLQRLAVVDFLFIEDFDQGLGVAISLLPGTAG